MPYKVVYFDEVKQDIKEAKDWYRLQLKGLEKRFAHDYQKSYSSIEGKTNCSRDSL